MAQGRVFLKSARLVDGTGAPARDGAAVIVEGETIVHAGPLSALDTPAPADAQVIDLGGRTVIPGLVEAHIHLSYNRVKAGKLADLVVVDGDPLRDIGILQDRARLSVMKGGRFTTGSFS